MRVNRQRVITALEWLIKHNPFYKDVVIKHENFEANIVTTGVHLTMVETKNNKKAAEEDEYVSTSNHNVENEDRNEMIMSTVHANEKQSVPSGRQSVPIKIYRYSQKNRSGIKSHAVSSHLP